MTAPDVIRELTRNAVDVLPEGELERRDALARLPRPPGGGVGVGADRLAAKVSGLRGPAFAVGLAYGINPAARNSVAEGRLGPLVMFALLPFLVSQVVTLARRGRSSPPQPSPAFLPPPYARPGL